MLLMNRAIKFLIPIYPLSSHQGFSPIFLSSAYNSSAIFCVMSQLDTKIDEMLTDFRNWFERLCRGKSRTHQRRLRGIALLIDAKKEGTD